MANTTISPEMNLPVPTVSVDPGPDWANNINSCLGIIDSHNHSTGQGVPITPSGLDINADLSFNANNATNLRSTRFTAQASPLSGAADLGCLYESGVDLYYNDGAGNQVRITSSGSVNAGAGSITGLPSGTASASFSAGTFTWQSATNTPASMSQGPTRIAQATASGFGVTISASGSQASNYNMALPISLPSALSLMSLDTSGNMGTFPFVNVTTYTPTITAVANISSFGSSGWYYARLGNLVVVFGNVDITYTAASTFTSLTISVPVARLTNFTDNLCSGVGQSVDSGGLITLGLRGDTSTTTTVHAEGTTFAGESGGHNTRFIFAYTLG